MSAPLPRRVRIRITMRKWVDRAKKIARHAGARITRVAPFPLVVVALAIIVLQPWPEPVDVDALVAIAGIVATVLSLGFTVTLLVAQHTAERHAHALYAEFRREGAWLRVLGWLAAGVVTIVAASLLRPTLSTAFASLMLVVALGLYAASLLPLQPRRDEAGRTPDRQIGPRAERHSSRL